LENLRVPPHNIDAEQSVLGAMLLDRNAIAEVTDILNGSEFYRESHNQLFNAIVELYDRDEPVDMVTLVDFLRSKSLLESVGGVSYMSNLVNSVPTTANVKYYAKIVAEKYTLRRMILSSSEIIEKCYAEQDNVQDVLSQAEKGIFDISQNKSHKDFEQLNTIIVRSFDEFEKLYKNKGEITGLSSGFADLDRRTSGFQKSDFVLIAARPSMGKTAFMLNVALAPALRMNKSVAIFSLEMSKEQLVNRMICSEAYVDAQKLRVGDIDDDDWVKLAKAAGPLSNANIYIDDTPGISMSELRSKCRRLKIEKGLDMILIDYLQLMTAGRNIENRQQEVSEISRSLKGLAKEMSAPVIALSQLSRAPEARADHRPILSDLRESGSIEQDADVVIFLYRDEYYNKDTEKKNIAEIIIAKQRNGPTGTTELAWLGQYTKFGNLDRYHND
jgi:replicative DNA helicase